MVSDRLPAQTGGLGVLCRSSSIQYAPLCPVQGEGCFVTIHTTSPRSADPATGHWPLPGWLWFSHSCFTSKGRLFLRAPAPPHPTPPHPSLWENSMAQEGLAGSLF